MSSIGSAHADALLSLSLSSDVFVALLTHDVPASVPGDALPEPGYAGYSRLLVHPASWAAPSGGRVANAVDLVFPACTAGDALIVGFALVDAVSAGTVLWVGRRAQAVVVDPVDNVPTFSAGALQLALL